VPGLILHSFYVELVLINLVYSLNLEVLTKSQIFSPDLPKLGLIRAV